MRQIGCSNYSAKQVIAAEDAAKRSGLAPFVTCQDEYSLLVRGIERDLVPLMRERGMTLLPYSPLASGLLTGKYRRSEPLPKGTRLAYSSHHASTSSTSATGRSSSSCERCRRARATACSISRSAGCWRSPSPPA